MAPQCDRRYIDINLTFSNPNQNLRKMTFSRAKSFRQKSKMMKSQSPVSKSALNLQMFETNSLLLQLRPKSESLANDGKRETKMDATKVDGKITKYLKKFKVRKMLKSISKIKITESKTELKTPILGKRESIISTSGSSIVIWEELYETLRRTNP